MPYGVREDGRAIRSQSVTYGFSQDKVNAARGALVVTRKNLFRQGIVESGVRLCDEVDVPIDEYGGFVV